MSWVIQLGASTLDNIRSFGRAFLMLTGALIALPQLKNVRLTLNKFTW